MKIKNFVLSNEKILSRIFLCVLLVLVGGFLFFEQCTPVFSVFIKIWLFLSRVVSGVWSGLGWPHSVLICFVITLSVYRNEIRSLLPRITGVGKDGLQLSPPSAEQNAQPPAETAAEADGAVIGVKGALFPHEMEIARHSIEVDLQEARPESELAFLRADLAFWRVICLFENTYSIIFGGQIRLLKYLNQRAAVGVSPDELNILWGDHVKELNLSPEWNLEDYLRFLLNRALIEHAPNNNVVITQRGNEFLIWMAKTGKTENKPW